LLVDFFDSKAMAVTVSEALANRSALGALRQQARRDAVAGYDLQTICLPAQLRLVADVAAGRTPQA
jgi:hypothetical protein